jgi:hypothetical protein
MCFDWVFTVVCWRRALDTMCLWSRNSQYDNMLFMYFRHHNSFNGVKIASVAINQVIDAYVLCEGWHFSHTWKALACPQHSIKRKVLTHKTSLTPPLFIEVSVPSQKSERSCICVLVASIWPLSTIFFIEM